MIDGAASPSVIENASGRGRSGRATSIFLTSTDPISGIWVPSREYAALDRRRRWRLVGDDVQWLPYEPPDAALKEPAIRRFRELVDTRRNSGPQSFRKLSGTSKTGTTWSLPAVASCPVIDGTCGNCYALDGWYRTSLDAQVGRVLRLEYLRELIATRELGRWVDWAVGEIRRIAPSESVPIRFRDQLAGVPETASAGRTAFFRWHDSGDLFHRQYAEAVLEVCRRTPSVLHWLPTRMVALVAGMLEEGLLFPPNLAVHFSIDHTHPTAPQRISAIAELADRYPTARIGVTYVYQGARSRAVGVTDVTERFGADAFLCPATVASRSEDRNCIGCRRCWAKSSVTAPVVYAIHRGN
jgi:hypothetical protein